MTTTAKKTRAKATSTVNSTQALPSPANNVGGQIGDGTHMQLAAHDEPRAEAIPILAPKEGVPPRRKRKAGAIEVLASIPRMPRPRKRAGGHVDSDTQSGSAAPPPTDGQGSGDRPHIDIQPAYVPALADQLRECQAQRVATIKAQLRLNNQSRSLVRRVLGWRWEMPEAERKVICKQAEEIVRAVEAGIPMPEGHARIADIARPFILAGAEARKPLDAYRKQLEKEMERIARLLPVWPWVEAINGMGALGLAIIVGECGDLSNYANPGKLWKRLGLAPKDAYADVTKDGEPCFKLPKRRRSAMWTLGDSLLKKKNAYRDLYLARKEYERERDPEMTKMHSHRRAQRYAEKRLLRDLWRAWR